MRRTTMLAAAMLATLVALGGAAWAVPAGPPCVGDECLGTSGNDTIYGHDEGGDYLYGGSGGDDHLYGLGNGSLESWDYLDGGPGGDDVIFGGEGSDYADGRDGADVIRGGAGRDEGHTNDDAEWIEGGLVGGPGPDTVRGGSGDDELRGGRGKDRLFGGPDNDEFTMIFLDDADGARDIVNCGDGTDTVYMLDEESDTDVLRGCEEVVTREEPLTP